MHDVVVLDQDMAPGQEDYGRSASPAWTLVQVLERGAGNYFGGPIRLWYLDGGFEAFQSWDVDEKCMAHHGIIPEDQTEESVDRMMLAPKSQHDTNPVYPLSAPMRLPSNDNNTDAKTAHAIDVAVSLTNASLGGSPRQPRVGPARRESLFSLNTKSLQRPAGLSRSQTVGMTGAGTVNLKPISIMPPVINATESSNQGVHPFQEGSGNSGAGAVPLPPLRSKGSWLTVPALNAGGPLDQSTSSSTQFEWPVNSGNGWGHGSTSQTTIAASENSTDAGPLQTSAPPAHGMFMIPAGLSSKKSFSSTTTLSSLYRSGTPTGIREEDEHEDGARGGANLLGATTAPGLRRHQSGGANSTRSGHFGAETVFPQPTHPFQPSGYLDDDNMDGEENFDANEQEISCILPGFLYLGPEIVNADQVEILRGLGVRRILNMATECEDALVNNCPERFEYHKIGVHDHIEADVSVGLLQAVDIIGMATS